MNKIVDLYLSQKNVPTRFDIVQGSQAPGITFVLKDYEPNTGATARIFIKKKESEVYNTCTLEGNEVTYNPTVTSFDEPGKCTAQLEIVSGGKIAMSYRLYINVEPNIVDSSAIEATDDFSALQDAILAVGDISEYKVKTDQNTANIASLGNEVDSLSNDLSNLGSELDIAKDDIDAIERKTDKIGIRSSVENVQFGLAEETNRIMITGDSTDKIKIAVENNQEIGWFMFQAKADALVLSDQNAGVELFRINGPYPKGTYTINSLVGTGYLTTGGNAYFWFETPRTIPVGATVTDIQMTSTTIRGVNGLIVNRADITENIDNILRGVNGNPRVKLSGLSTNYAPNTPAFIDGVLTFTLV